MELPIIYRGLPRRKLNNTKNFIAGFEHYSTLAFLLVKENLGKIFTKSNHTIGLFYLG